MGKIADTIIIIELIKKIANIDKIKTFRYALPDTPLALASGITSKNVYNYTMVDCFMVSTGINFTGDFYNIDPHKLN